MTVMKQVKYLLLPLVMLLMTAVSMHAQKADREEWNNELNEFRHDFLAKELQLTDAQKAKFFALYDAMSRERRTLRRQVRNARKELDAKGSAAKEADYAAFNKLELEANGKINDVETKYYKQFKSVLTAKQQSHLKEAEDKFAKTIRKLAREKRLDADLTSNQRYLL